MELAMTVLPEPGSGTVASMTEFPLAPRGSAWDGDTGEAAIRAKTGAEGGPNAAYGTCFFWHDVAAAERYGSYKLLYCDVIDDEIRAVPHAIFAVAGILDGARGGNESGGRPGRDQDGRWRVVREDGQGISTTPCSVRRGLEAREAHKPNSGRRLGPAVSNRPVFDRRSRAPRLRGGDRGR